MNQDETKERGKEIDYYVKTRRNHRRSLHRPLAKKKRLRSRGALCPHDEPINWTNGLDEQEQKKGRQALKNNILSQVPFELFTVIG